MFLESLKCFVLVGLEVFDGNYGRTNRKADIKFCVHAAYGCMDETPFLTYHSIKQRRLEGKYLNAGNVFF